MIEAFDEEAFLCDNLVAQESVGNYSNFATYLSTEGLERIERGEMKFHHAFEPFDESLYLHKFDDVKEAINEEKFASAFEHFFLYGYREIVTYERFWNAVYGHIDSFDHLTIEGWAGQSSSDRLEITLLINEIPVESVIKTFSREDLEHHHLYKGCQGFIAHVESKKLVEVCDPSNQEVCTISIKVNGTPVEHSFDFSYDCYFEQIAKRLNVSTILYRLEFFKIGLANYLCLEQLIDALDWLERFGVYPHEKSIIDPILDALMHISLDNEADYIRLHSFLFHHHDILSLLMYRINRHADRTLIKLIQQLLRDINYHKAQEMIDEVCQEGSDLFVDPSIVSEKEHDQLLVTLVKNPHKRLEVWEGFDERRKQERLFHFINLTLFLQDFEELKYLDITLNDFRLYFRLDNTSTIEEIASYLWKSDKAWEGFLFSIYVISVGVSDRLSLRLAYQMVESLEKLPHIDTPALAWILQTHLFKLDYSLFGEIKRLMDHLSSVIEKRSLWRDEKIREIYQSYLELLMKYQDSALEHYYKLLLKHYLLHRGFTLSHRYFNPFYIVESHYLWMKDIEIKREELFSVMYHFDDIHRVLSLLDQLEYLAPHAIETVKFHLANMILNLHLDSVLIEKAERIMREVGGAYDRSLLPSSWQSPVSRSYHQSALIGNTMRSKEESLNNYWYAQALHTRQGTWKRRELFLEELYTFLISKNETFKDIDRLVRLFFSEVLWTQERLLKKERADHAFIGILKKRIKEISDQFPVMDHYYRILLLYIKLLSLPKERMLKLRELFGAIGGFQSRDFLKKLLKRAYSNSIEVEEARNLIRQSMLYPYTLVMIYSCQKYIPTRQKVIEETWLNRLKAFGIDYLFVVGGAKVSHIQGDRLYLDVDDAYEYLPQKSIEMFRFASSYFGHERFLKIDDDCFLNVDAYFSDNVLFDGDYYGRYLERGLGSMDRTWHQSKSKTLKAQKSLDLSPEPSYYADGSTGYLLSRKAIAELLDAYADEKHIELVAHSYMEDKLVGDLLLSRGVKVNAMNFSSLIYRRFSSNHEATYWSYNIFPKAKNSMKIMHAETPESIYRVWEQFFKSDSNQEQSRYFSNQPLNYLKLTTPYLEALKVHKDKLHQSSHVAIIVSKNERLYLNQLLEHHRSIGIEHFIYIDNASSDGSVEFMLEQEDVSSFVTTQSYKAHQFGVDWVEIALCNFCIGKWVLVIDSDELFVYDDFENYPISALTAYATTHGYDSFFAPMVDMYSKQHLSRVEIQEDLFYRVCNYFDVTQSMSIIEKDSLGPYSNSMLYGSGLRERVFGGYNIAPVPSYLNQKYPLFKYQPTHTIREGLHFMYNHNPAPLKTALLHFKYHAGFHKKVIEQVASGEHWNGSQEYKQYLKVLEAQEEQILYDEELSLEFKDSSSLIEAGYMDKIFKEKK
jgi:hypothetical protein